MNSLSIRDRIRNALYRRSYSVIDKHTRSTGVNIHGTVEAYLTDEDGVRTLVVKKHNKWTTSVGLWNFKKAVEDGCNGTSPMQVHSMNLGSVYSTSSWTSISSTRQNTSNGTGTSPPRTIFDATWGASGAINSIRQAGLQQYDYDGTGSKVTNPTVVQLCSVVALDSGGFNKPDGTTLDIEWTVTFTS